VKRGAEEVSAALADGFLPEVWQRSEALPDMTDRQFKRWVSLLEHRTGMAMPPERRSFLVTSVGLRMREVGYEDYDAYFQHLTSGLFGNLEWTALVDRLTVHETRFFRDGRAIRLLEQEVLPGLVAQENWDGECNLWSVGCSTGEEVYTLAMLAHAFLTDVSSTTRFGVTGTDISLHSLAAGKSGTYPERRLRDIPADYQRAYCEALDRGRFCISEQLRRRVCFAQMNICDAVRLPSRQMDVIYCQNLLIYFDRERRRELVDGLVHHLRPGGVLILGAGEVLTWEHPRMQRLVNAEDVLAYRRRG